MISATVPTNVGITAGSQPTYSRSVAASIARISSLRLSIGILIESNLNGYGSDVDKIAVVENIYVLNNSRSTKLLSKCIGNIAENVRARTKQVSLFSRQFVKHYAGLSFRGSNHFNM